ncbi:hypothetical protein HMPREF1869_00868 [Bacteroidales bacterium KA00251]|nr:hypothetical protein HMPREF1869_00868 [Bacteroidales bacterium KA00251]
MFRVKVPREWKKSSERFGKKFREILEKVPRDFWEKFKYFFYSD